MIYRFQAFGPKDRIFPGCWGFDAELDSRVALVLRQMEMKSEVKERFQESGRMTIKGYGLNKMGEIKNPYSFVDDSFLLRGLKVPGDSCDLALGESDRENYLDDFARYKKWAEENPQEFLRRPVPVSYMPHNVDTPLQASALLNLFVDWANLAEVLCNESQK
jgi:hypothetical protein